MNEITRIHLAKTPYNIELTAKKILESYLKSLESYAHDTELVRDIELRMVELLAERSVKPEGTIAIDDVEALRKQLGEPEEFIDDTDTLGPEAVVADRSSRKLYRHTNRAIFGGVAGGIAEYFGINPLWVRLIMIALAFASFGTAIVVYIVLWIVVPPVRTAADLLQLRGKPVTVSAIREAATVDGPIEQGHDKKVLKIVTVLLGIGAVVAALGAIIATLSVIGWSPYAHETFAGVDSDLYFWLIFCVVLGGLLLTSLFSLMAYAAFRQKISKRIVVSAVVIILLGLTTLAGAIGIGYYQSQQQQAYIERNTKEVTVPLEAAFSSIKDLTIAVNNTNVTYIVDDNPRIVFTAFNGKSIQPEVVLEDQAAVITIEQRSHDTWFHYDPGVTIYGPALESVNVTSGYLQYRSAEKQSQLSVNIDQAGVVVEIEDATIETVTATVAGGAQFNAIGAAVESAIIVVDPQAAVTLGHVRQLTLTTQESCPAFGEKAVIEVASVSESEMTLNGQAVSARSSSTTCTDIEISHLEDLQ